MTDHEMLKQIWDEIRDTRQYLRDHAESNDRQFDKMRDRQQELSDEIASQKTTFRLVNGGIAVLIAAFVSWAVNTFIGQ